MITFREYAAERDNASNFSSPYKLTSDPVAIRARQAQYDAHLDKIDKLQATTPQLQSMAGKFGSRLASELRPQQAAQLGRAMINTGRNVLRNALNPQQQQQQQQQQRQQQQDQTGL